MTRPSLHALRRDPEGAPRHPPVLLAHGLFGQGRNLAGLARRLGADRRTILADMRNHGDSFWHDRHDYLALADDLAALASAEAGPVDVVGHSMGGKAAMAMALRHPGAVRRLVVLDIAPVAYGHDQHATLDALDAVDPAAVTRRAEADAILAGAGIDDADVRGFLLQSLDLKARRWVLNREALRAEMDAVTGWPDALAGSQWLGPVLVLAGGDSDYVDADGEAALRAAFPAVDIRRIAGAGHWVHAAAPDAVAAAVAGFLG